MHTFESQDGWKFSVGSNGSGDVTISYRNGSGVMAVPMEELRMFLQRLDVILSSRSPVGELDETLHAPKVERGSDGRELASVTAQLVATLGQLDARNKLLNATTNFARGALMVSLSDDRPKAWQEVDYALMQVARLAVDKKDETK